MSYMNESDLITLSTQQLSTWWKILYGQLHDMDKEDHSKVNDAVKQVMKPFQNDPAM